MFSSFHCGRYVLKPELSKSTRMFGWDGVTGQVLSLPQILLFPHSSSKHQPNHFQDLQQTVFHSVD